MLKSQKGKLQFSVIVAVFIIGMFTMGFLPAPVFAENPAPLQPITDGSSSPVTVRNDFVFIANGGSFGSETVKIIAQNTGSKYKLPEEPTFDNKIFIGWYTKDRLGGWGSRVTASTIVKADHKHILFARWKLPDISVEADLTLSGSGSGWHGKLVLYNPADGTAISFGIQHDAHSALGFANKDALMFESIFQPEPKYKAFKEVEPGVKHHIRIAYDKSRSIAIGYCDGAKIAEMSSPKMDKWFVVGIEASSRLTGDTVDAHFENIVIYANDNQEPSGYWIDYLNNGNFAISVIDNGPGAPPGSEGAAYATVGGFHLWGTADLPGGDWDSYATVGAKTLMNIN